MSENDHASPRKTLRAGDNDREAVAEVLRQSAGDGRLDLDELDERLERAYAAKTYAELDELVADLPVTAMPSEHAPVLRSPARKPGRDDKPLILRATLDNQSRSGAWEVPAVIEAEPLFANVKLNFMYASCPFDVVDLTIRPGSGAVVLIMPEGWGVDTEELNKSWGTVRNKIGQAAAGKPTIEVRGSVGMSSFVARPPYFYEKD
ncbi:DUF1707 domain-containing protein [Saxibacter everestensis]|uniref:DUF1707 domain-containing protein n=1 Tax=Saxibacter everestensis TaxID=2909229 RepID=A0ABY8QQ97_9MICO|nr:DUF1707 domain-containing protein [Brevibacteriaceae bacterium ZFBP1038]